MLKVYCDICGEEITEDAKGEGIDWNELTIKREPQGIVVLNIEHICERCNVSLIKNIGHRTGDK